MQNSNLTNKNFPTKTTLWSGRTTDLTTIQLNDELSNYDFVMVTFAGIFPTLFTTSGDALSKKSTTDNGNTFVMCTDVGYLVFSFPTSTSLQIIKGYGSYAKDQGVTSVIGIKF